MGRECYRPITHVISLADSQDKTAFALAANNRQVEQKQGGRGREWVTLGLHPLSWLLSNNQLEKVPFVSVPHTFSNRLLLISNQDKGCTPSVAHSLPLPLGPALLNLWIKDEPMDVESVDIHKDEANFKWLRLHNQGSSSRFFTGTVFQEKFVVSTLGWL